MIPPAPTFDHVLRLTDDVGIFEHARWSTPRRELGYCVDDVARALVVVAREPEPSAAISGLTSLYIDFVLDAQAPDGRFHNRLGLDRQWHDEASTEDCWGRALWGLGTVAARSVDPVIRELAVEGFARGARWRCTHRRAMAFAALGAAEISAVMGEDPGAGAVLSAAARTIGRPTGSAAWPWPEARLTYANAALPEALIAAGDLLGDARTVDDGLQLLGWLLDVETRDDHLSVTPAGGWSLGDVRPGFDQQPIEAAALADACARAFELTGDTRWAEGVELAVGWFLGRNDNGTCLYEPMTGGGCDGLHAVGRNENQGAESTLALIATLQHARQLVPS